MEWIRLIGFCLLTAVMVMILRQMHPQSAGLLSVAFGVMAVGAALPQLGAYVQIIRSFLASLGLEAQYYQVMLKAMGIVLITQLAVQVCQDMDAPSIAARAEFFGRLALVGIAVPIFMELTQMAVDVLR